VFVSKFRLGVVTDITLEIVRTIKVILIAAFIHVYNSFI